MVASEDTDADLSGSGGGGPVATGSRASGPGRYTEQLEGALTGRVIRGPVLLGHGQDVTALNNGDHRASQMVRLKVCR